MAPTRHFNTIEKDSKTNYYLFWYKRDIDNKAMSVRLWDEYYFDYYQPGYLTDDMLLQVVKGKTINFTARKNGSDIKVTIKLIPYVTKRGHHMNMLELTIDESKDKLLIESNAEKIIQSYYHNSKFDYTRPQKIIDSLGLIDKWKTFAKHSTIEDDLCEISISIYINRNSDSIMLYGKVKNDICDLISEEEHKALLAYKDKLEQEYYEKLDELYNTRNTLLNWLKSIVNTIYSSGSTKLEDIVNVTDPLVVDISVPDIENRIISLLNTSSYSNILKRYIESAKDLIMHNITIKNYNDPNAVDNIKLKILQNIKVFVEYAKIIVFRNNLLKDCKTKGLESITNSINIDTALDLGCFNTLQKILVKSKANVEYCIIMNTYLDIIDLPTLETNLLNLLKVYYDFYNMPEKDRKSIAKYIAKNKLKDYYDRIRYYEDVYDILIDNSTDTSLLRPIIDSYIGTPKTSTLKDKTFYFEKRGRLVSRQKHSELILYKPIELVEDLRSYIKRFNNASDVAILINIELDADESFIFQFYTFSENSGDDKGFDGRRMLNLTKIYNQEHPNRKIGFSFNNNDSLEDEDN